MKNRNSATTTGAAIIQSLERYAPLFSKPWNVRSTRFPALALLSFALLLPVPVAAATSVELPGENDADWPLMSVLLEHERIAEQAERLTGDPRTARTAEQHLQRFLRGRDEQEQ